LNNDRECDLRSAALATVVAERGPRVDGHLRLCPTSGVVAGDEVADGGGELGGIVEDAAPDDLLLERAEDPGAGKPPARICEGESRMAELLDHDPLVAHQGTRTAGCCGGCGHVGNAALLPLRNLISTAVATSWRGSGVAVL
jgi:hypothetical protein